MSFLDSFVQNPDLLRFKKVPRSLSTHPCPNYVQFGRAMDGGREEVFHGTFDGGRTNSVAPWMEGEEVFCGTLEEPELIFLL